MATHNILAADGLPPLDIVVQRTYGGPHYYFVAVLTCPPNPIHNAISSQLTPPALRSFQPRCNKDLKAACYRCPTFHLQKVINIYI